MIASGHSWALHPLQADVTLSVDGHSVDVSELLVMSAGHEFVDPLFDFAIETKPSDAGNSEKDQRADSGEDTEYNCDVEEHAKLSKFVGKMM